VNGLASESEGSAEADISNPSDPVLQDMITDDEITVDKNESDELIQESGEEEEEHIIEEEDNMDEDISLDRNDNYPVPEKDQDIDFSSSSDFRIEVDLGRQKVFVYYKEKIIREMICSGGAESSPTPMGEFTTSQKIEYDWVDRFDMGAYYWVRFYKTYLFHSIPFDENGNMMMEEYEKLGNPASHGCIRLKLEEAKWLYENLPLGVRVLIYKEK
jgi:lipoprotein-anchoring transpeptidase ErfK/SrfK